MTITTVTTAIKTQLETVSSIGNVYDYQRYANQWDDYLGFFKTTISGSPVIRGWTIALESIPVDDSPYDTDPDAPMNLWRYNYTLRGYLGVDDSAASEKTARGLAVDVVKAIRSKREELASTVLTVSTPQVAAIAYQMFGGVLCHYIEISFEVWEMD